MLRHFYLIILLLCIEWSFSYNYIDDATGRDVNNYGMHVKKSKKGRNNRKNLIRRQYNYDRIPVEFDVASFIQPDEEAIEEDDAARTRNKKRRHMSGNDYGTLIEMQVNLEDENKKKDKTLDYLNIGGENVPDISLNEPLLKDSLNSKHISLTSLDEIGGKYSEDKYKNPYRDDIQPDATHTPDKKSAFKRIKIPFFSHNKSGTLETKKTKKRKLFCFNCAKKEAKQNPDGNKTINEDPLLQYKIKRSYEERLCPVCKKKFIAISKPNDRRKKTPKKIIHNSRQYQNNAQAKLEKDLKKIRKFSFDDPDAVDDGNRKKREGEVETNIDRQIKELNEVQKRVDSVSINVPKFANMPSRKPAN